MRDGEGSCHFIKNFSPMAVIVFVVNVAFMADLTIFVLAVVISVSVEIVPVFLVTVKMILVVVVVERIIVVLIVIGLIVVVSISDIFRFDNQWGFKLI